MKSKNEFATNKDALIAKMLATLEEVVIYTRDKSRKPRGGSVCLDRNLKPISGALLM